MTYRLPGSRKQHLPSFFALALALALGSLPAGDAAAQLNCRWEQQKSPYKAAEEVLWTGLRPLDLKLPGDRDNTAFTQNGAWTVDRPYWRAIDVAAGSIFTTFNRGIHIWQPDASGRPKKLGAVLEGSIVNKFYDSHDYIIFHDADATPDGKLLGVTGIGSIGFLLYDVSDKSRPRLVYQDGGNSGAKHAYGTYVTTISGNHYGFMAAHRTDGGLWAYDATAGGAAGASTACVEVQPHSKNCSNVAIGRLTQDGVAFVEGAGNDSQGHFLAVSGGPFSKGVRIYDVSSPRSAVASPASALRLTGLAGRQIDEVAMWEAGGKLLLALVTRFPNEGHIYDVSCVRNGNCQLPAPQYVFPMTLGGVSATGTVSFSESNGRPYLYFGSRWVHVLSGLQNEWLLDVSHPASPAEVLGGDPTGGNRPQTTAVFDGLELGYWSWYYACHPSGSNYMEPAGGMFLGDVLYRVGGSVFDAHKLENVDPTIRVNAAESQVFEGEGVSVTAQALNCTPSAGGWTWSADGGNVTGSGSTVSVQWPTAGTKTVKAANSACANATQIGAEVQVATAAPAIGTLAPDVVSALTCSPVTFTAGGVTGKPTLSFQWEILDGSGDPLAAPTLALSANKLQATWDTAADQPDPGAGPYTARLTVSNGVLPDAVKTSVPVTILPVLDPAFAATPITATVSFGDVAFQAHATGATEWLWDFGDLQTLQTTDPVLGPAPTHKYDAVKTYDVKVAIRNCVATQFVESTVVPVTITEINPLVINSFAAKCPFGLCLFDTGTAITLEHDVDGDPEFYDYDWNGDGSFEDSGNLAPKASHVYNSPGTYTPRLRVRRGTAEKVSAPLSLQVVNSQSVPPSISVAGPGSGQPGTNYTYSASANSCTPASTWTWTASGGGTVTGSGATVQIRWSSTGSKSVTAKNSGCGSATGSKLVTISDPSDPPPSGGSLDARFTFTPASPKAGDTVSFNGGSSTGSPTFYSWTFPGGVTKQGQVVSHTFAESGSFPVKLEVGRNDPSCSFGFCSDAETKTVAVTPVDNSGGLAAQFTVSPSLPEAGQAVTFDASGSSGSPTLYSWTFPGGVTRQGQVVSHTFDGPGNHAVELEVGKQDSSCNLSFCSAKHVRVVQVLPKSTPSNGCQGALADDNDKLCLGEGRYIVEVDWENHHDESRPTGEGRFRRLGGSESTGFFWFFNPDSIDLIVKIIDGSVLNDHVWVFYGALTDVIYDLEVTDTLTGQSKTYRNLAGSICGNGDTTAFSTAGLSVPATAGAASATVGDTSKAVAEATATEELLLLGGRFRATVEWENHHVPEGTPRPVGVGKSVTGTDGSGYFSFFEPSSLDLVIKMIDARSFDGHFWVFYGGLSDVRYTLHIEDLETGQTWEAINPAGSICGGSDTAAFSETGD